VDEDDRRPAGRVGALDLLGLVLGDIGIGGDRRAESVVIGVPFGRRGRDWTGPLSLLP
jgi:hypothetical protein